MREKKKQKTVEINVIKETLQTGNDRKKKYNKSILANIKTFRYKTYLRKKRKKIKGKFSCGN